MNLLEALVNAIRLPELRNKILFTGGILVASGLGLLTAAMLALTGRA